jgi:beta-glucosidase
VQTTQINTQQDAKLVSWLAPARFFAWAAQKQRLRSYMLDQGVLQFDLLVQQAAQGPVTLAMECEAPCKGEVDLSAVLKKIPLKTKHTVKIPLTCLEEAGADSLNVEVPFSVSANRPFSAAFTNIRVVAGAAKDADTLSCPDVGVNLK